MSRKPGLGNLAFVSIIAVVAVALIVILAVFAKKSPPKPTETTENLKIGDQAPAFELPSVNAGKISLAKYDGSPVILYFNEGVGCQPCWQQITDWEKDQKFTDLNIPMVAIAPNKASDWEPVTDSYPMKTPILTDTSNDVSRAYGMLTMKSSMHKGVNPGHTFLVLDKDHKLVWIGDYPRMNMTVDEIVSVIKEKIK